MERGEARLELAKEYTGIFFKLNHSAAALADFLKATGLLVAFSFVCSGGDVVVCFPFGSTEITS